MSYSLRPKLVVPLTFARNMVHIKDSSTVFFLNFLFLKKNFNFKIFIQKTNIQGIIGGAIVCLHLKIRGKKSKGLQIRDRGSTILVFCL